MNLAWVDVETTGTDYRLHDVIELGVIITDDKFCEIARSSWVVCDTTHNRVWNQVALDMHAKSGLLSELKDGISIFDASVSARAFIDQHNAVGSPMCGASVHFDRAFIQEQCKSMYDAFSYRNFDVSSLVQAAKLVGLDVLEIKRNHHRVMPDIEDSIELARQCVQYFYDSKYLSDVLALLKVASIDASASTIVQQIKNLQFLYAEAASDRDRIVNHVGVLNTQIKNLESELKKLDDKLQLLLSMRL